MYTITFEDTTTFEGGKDLTASQWNEMPQKLIISIDYEMWDRYVIVEGYAAYNHLVEYSCNVLTGQQMMSKVVLLAKKHDAIVAIVFDLLNMKIYCEPRPLDDYRKTTGWKEGVYLAKNGPKFTLL